MADNDKKLSPDEVGEMVWNAIVFATDNFVPETTAAKIKELLIARFKAASDFFKEDVLTEIGVNTICKEEDDFKKDYEAKSSDLLFTTGGNTVFSEDQELEKNDYFVIYSVNPRTISIYFMK